VALDWTKHSFFCFDIDGLDTAQDLV